MVCNGHHWQPKYPNYPGKFTGEFLHSHQFKKAAPFKDKKVLVIGGGNSACDVAVETSRISKKRVSVGEEATVFFPNLSWETLRCFCFLHDFLPVGLRNFFAGNYGSPSYRIK